MAPRVAPRVDVGSSWVMALPVAPRVYVRRSWEFVLLVSFVDMGRSWCQRRFGRMGDAALLLLFRGTTIVSFVGRTYNFLQRKPVATIVHEFFSQAWGLSFSAGRFVLFVFFPPKKIVSCCRLTEGVACVGSVAFRENTLLSQL